MKYLIYICCLIFTVNVFSQADETLAKDYFDKGEFEKALISYQKLYNENLGNTNFFFRIIEIYQQLEHYQEAELMLMEKINSQRNPQYIVELGYNYQAAGDQDEAEFYYQQAENKIEEEPMYAYYVANRFVRHSLIERAARVYERAMELRPESNYYIQLGRIYGELAKTDKMFDCYVNYIERNENFIHQAKRIFSQFISENSDDENNIHLRRSLLRKIQSSPNILWNQLLSWLFIQQRDYGKAFAQER